MSERIEKDQGEVEERRDLEVRHGALELPCDAARERVARVEEVQAESVRRDSDHLRDRDRLSDSAAEPEHRRREQARTDVGDYDPPDRLPPGGAESHRAVLDVFRDAGEELARHAGDDGDDHDHEHDHGRQHAGARVAERRLGEERRPAKRRGECRRDVVPHDRPERR